MFIKKLGLLFLLVNLISLQACAPAVIAGVAAGGTLIAQDRRSAGTFIDDKTLSIKALHCLKKDHELWSNSHITPVIYNKMVILVGQTPSQEYKNRAQKILSKILPPHHIHNELEVSPPIPFVQRTQDAWLTAMVKTKIANTKHLQVNKIKVVTENSVVYLIGIVDAKEENLAIETARRIIGVKKVIYLFQKIKKN